MSTTSTLSVEQGAAVESTCDNLLMIAGPGSGKTHTLVARTQRLIEQGASPSTMAVITFTNEAANELVKRAGVQFAYCGTLHGYLLRLLQQFGDRIGLRETISVVDKAMHEELVKEIQAECKAKSLPQRDIKVALNKGPQMLSRLQEKGGLDKADTVALCYYQRIVQASMLDYDSILHFGRQLIENLTPWDIKLLYLFVDEYQDSSTLDDVIYATLPVPEKFFIGDPDQSIYGFRGADVRCILDVSEREEFNTLALEDNYRSDQAITEAAQRLIEHNTNRTHKQTRSMSENPGKVEVVSFPYELDETEYLAKRIMALPDKNEVAILVRYNAHVEFFRERLKAYGVPMPRIVGTADPKDWNKARLLLSLLCDPENDRLAYSWLVATEGREAADRIKLQALTEYNPINDVVLHLPAIEKVSPEMAAECLARKSISRESIMRVEAAVAALPEGARLPELVAALQYDAAPKVEGEGVTVCTIHGAKGREWDHVFLPAFEQETLPSEASLKAGNVEEDRRLAFVAMTRARHTLTISFSEVRSKQWGRGEEAKQPSQFIAEAGLETGDPFEGDL